LGAGAYSLVAQTITAAAVSSLQLWLITDWRPKWGWSAREASGLWGFAGHLVGFNTINYFSRNADGMVIGRFLGADALGAYSLAYRIMVFPVQNLTFVATRALFPVMSRRQSFPDELGQLYLRTLSVIALFTAPMMAGLFVLREPFVLVVLGSKWTAVIQIIAFLAPVGFIQSLNCSTGTVFAARGRTDLLFRLGVFGAIVQVSAFLIGLRWGVTGVAACYLVANVIYAIPCLFFALKQVNRSLFDLAAAIWRPIILALLMALVLSALRSAIPNLAVINTITFVTLVCLGCVLYLFSAYLLSGAILRDMLRLLPKW
jgi:PST family polysaccharide transporter